MAYAAWLPPCKIAAGQDSPAGRVWADLARLLLSDHPNFTSGTLRLECEQEKTSSRPADYDKAHQGQLIRAAGKSIRPPPPPAPEPSAPRSVDGFDKEQYHSKQPALAITTSGDDACPGLLVLSLSQEQDEAGGGAGMAHRSLGQRYAEQKDATSDAKIRS